MEAECPFCGGEIKSELVKRLRAQGLEVSLHHIQLCREIDRLKMIISNLKDEVEDLKKRPSTGDPLKIGGQ